ncbi:MULTISPECIES: amidohydrolase [unclassified Streptomyces]|uniref:amidohydrolase n=1 Tax=unclassified Streptomyces TaxID=2593676 RepID=UPI00087A0214|nr:MULTISPECIES: amidohydrolase [unclassified Streptomyces]REH20267.1 5-methylthioadenosine/S-adenosylhomocysteine deaminase [Streptomyces sp. 2221.1]SDT18120.1 5-methylthioadenosine/S-adenosylhomocysteine deaminase [Streptomyces sp. 2114.2]
MTPSSPEPTEPTEAAGHAGHAGPADLVISGCTVLVHDDRGRIGFEQDAAVVVRGGVVDSVTTAAAGASVPAADRIDARGQVALPGLINCHTHSPMVALRGLAEDLPTEEWFNDVVWPVESNLTGRDVMLVARLACAEMIRAGVTTFADSYFHMDAVAEVVDRCGMRAQLGQAYFSSQGPEGPAASLDFALRRRGFAGGRITTALAPHAPYTVVDADLAATAELARDHGLPVHLHAAENRDQTDTSLARHGVTPIGVLERTGVLDTDVLIAHGTGITEDDLPLLARAGGRTAVATAPRGYLKFGWPGTTPVRALRDIGVPVGLATDGAASNNSLDVWESMALTSLIQKSTEGDPRWLTSRQALHHATVQSARAVGLGDSVGRIAPGWRADLILVDLTGPHTQPVHDLAATLVHSARSADVRTTIVDGRVLMRDRELLTVDVSEVVRELGERLPALTDRGHGRRIQQYDT